MQLKLKENPEEWQKFTLVVLTIASGLTFLSWYQGGLPDLALRLLMLVFAFTATGCLVRPQSFRGFYRKGMTVSHGIGQIMGKVLLTLFFLVALTPLGLLMRALKKDPLGIRDPDPKSSCWRDGKQTSSLDRMF